MPRLPSLPPPEIGKVRINLSAIDSLFFIDNVKLRLAMPDQNKVLHGLIITLGGTPTASRGSAGTIAYGQGFVQSDAFWLG